jgi:hypothetical protein
MISEAHKETLIHDARLAARDPADQLSRQHAQRIIACYDGDDRREAQDIYSDAFKAIKSVGMFCRY